MAVQVEARSLSALNFLAANPPQYPVNPAEEKQESLTLYISRVPGTRDVILSTFKPQRRSVTGADVATSLYYVHLDLPSDGPLAAPQPIRTRDSPRSSGEMPRNTPTIARKPLPAGARVPNLQAGHSAPAGEAAVAVKQQPWHPAPEPWIPPGYRLDESASPGPPLDRATPQSSLQGPTQVHRKPLGPRPMDASTTAEMDLPRPPLPDEFSRSYPPPSTQLAPYSNSFRERAGPVPAPAPPAATSHPAPPMKREDSSGFVPFGLTLIRRDPATSSQWNVGKVTSYQAEEPTIYPTDPETPASPASNPRNGQPAINVHLETSGYAKFRGFPTHQSVELHRPGSSSSLPRSLLRGHGDEMAWKKKEEGFSRQLVMSYGKSWSSNIRKAFQRRSRSDSADDPAMFEDLEPPRRPPGMHARHGSENSLGSLDSVASGELPGGRETPPLITKPGPGLKPKGYVFTSPWDGRCEFRTGSGGRSLKCRHVLSNSSAVYNPLVMVQAMRDGQGLGHGHQQSIASAITGATPVSELRFNLPSSDLFISKRISRELPAKFDKLLKLDPRPDDSSDDDDDLPLDLSMGRERAGGGKKGKKAKLGKLIIHDEGMKMLDLVVACNIGIWWGAFERSF